MKAKKVTFVGLNGGVGRTSLVAHLTKSHAGTGQVPMAFDLDPQNTLGLYLGMSPSEGLGISHPSLDRSALAQLLRRHHATVPYLPFGAIREQALRTLEHQIARDGSWLTGRVESLVPNPCDVAFIDTPATPSVWLRAALKMADVVIAVLRPDAACYAALPRLQSMLRDVVGPESDDRTVYVVNRFDGSRGLDRDVLLAFEKTLGPRLLSVVVHECASIAEALARGETVGTEGSVVREDLQELTVRVQDVIQTIPSRHPARDAPPTNHWNVRRLAPVAGEDFEPWAPDEGRGRYNVIR